MVTGINTDVRFGDSVYHVQTQDLGARRRVLESLVYVEGQVLDTIESSYPDLPGCTPQSIHGRLIAQHRAVISSINEGKYAAFLAPAVRRVPQEPPNLVVTEIEDCFVGDRGSLMILVRTQTTYQPIAGADLEVFYPPSPAFGNRIYQARTDSKGFHVAEFRIPHATQPGASLLVRANCPSGSAESRVKVFRTAVNIPGAVDPDPGPPRPLPESEGAEGQKRPSLIVSELDEPRADRTVSLLMMLQEEHSQRPIPSAGLSVHFRVQGREPKVLYQASTDDKGFNLAEFRIPPTGGGKASLLIQATCDLGLAEVIFPVS